MCGRIVLAAMTAETAYFGYTVVKMSSDDTPTLINVKGRRSAQHDLEAQIERRRIMDEFNLQERFDHLKACVADVRDCVEQGKTVRADRLLAALYSDLTDTYQALDKLERTRYAPPSNL